MANSTIQQVPLKQKLSRDQQAKRFTRIAARAHARDLLGAQLQQQGQIIIAMARELEARRPINRLKRAASGVAGFFKPSRWQKQAARQDTHGARRDFQVRRVAK